MATLVRKRAQLLQTDDYGNTTDDSWQEAVRYFAKNVLVRDLGEQTITPLGDGVYTYINDLVVHATEKTSPAVFRDEMSGLEYESFCAKELERHGWQVTQTKGSGDQGVDLIAEKDDLRFRRRNPGLTSGLLAGNSIHGRHLEAS